MRRDDPKITVYYEWLDPLLKKIPLSETVKDYLDSISRMPRQELAVFAAHCCDAEICNGGLLQLFYNPTGIVVPEAYDGYMAVGKPELAAIVQRAANLLGEPYPRGWEERQEALLESSGKSLLEVEQIAEDAEHPYLGFQKVVEEMDFDKLSNEYYQNAIRWFFDEAGAALISQIRTQH